MPDSKSFEWGLHLPTLRAPRLVLRTLTHLSLTHERAEIGFALRQTQWGQGLGSEAVAATIDFAFQELGLHRIEADVDPRNERSLRLLEQLGFHREGHLRERYYMNGERQDAVMMAVLRTAWKSRER